MNQLEIQFFFPLTEQINLDLDFTPSVNYIEEKRKASITNGVLGYNLGVGNGSVIAASTICTTEFRPHPESVGYWAVSESVRYYVTKRPDWVIRKCTKFMLGWEWNDNK